MTNLTRFSGELLFPQSPSTPAIDSFVDNVASQIPVVNFVIDLALAAFLGFLLGRTYLRCGRAISNRSSLAMNFPLLATTTMLVITVVKSSLALSLGLVGALSIVRFRAAIKEPEELAYLFLAIAIGLGLGAGQRLITIMAFCVIAGLLFLRRFGKRKSQQQGLYLAIASAVALPMQTITETLLEHCSDANLARLEETQDRVEASFQVSFPDYGHLEHAKNALRKLDPAMTISVLDTRGVL